MPAEAGGGRLGIATERGHDAALAFGHDVEARGAPGENRQAHDHGHADARPLAARRQIGTLAAEAAEASHAAEAAEDAAGARRAVGAVVTTVVVAVSAGLRTLDTLVVTILVTTVAVITLIHIVAGEVVSAAKVGMTAVLLPVAARCAVQKFGEFLPETVEIVHPVVVIASIAAAAVVAAVVVTSVIVLVGTTGRLFVGGTIVPARLLVGGAAPAGVIERHMRCSSQQCLSLNGVSAGLRRTLLKTPELNLSF